MQNIVEGAYLSQIADQKDLLFKGDNMCHVKMEKGGEVDWHYHKGENEIYYILSGEGIFCDNDRSEHFISKGDVCKIGANEGHGIKNIGSKPLEFIALVIYE